MNETCVFIGGLDRSGKTYMRFMLESHPDLIFSKRTNMWTRYYKKFGSLDREENLQRCLDAMAKNKHIQALEPDYGQIRADMQKGPWSYPRLFELIHEQYMTRHQKNIWGDQTEFLERYAPQILQAYPGAKFIHLLRDPRDRYEAILNKSLKRHSPGIATARWLLSASLAKKYLYKYRDRYKVILYEEMVSCPEETMNEICDFLGVAYHPEMVKMENIARFASKPKADALQPNSPLSTEFIGRFHYYLDPRLQAFIQTFSRRYMRWFGYALVPVPVSWETISGKKVISWLSDILFMYGWQALDLVGRGR